MDKISIEELKCLGRNEGLVLQGCGGDLSEWVEGVNKELTDAGILKNGSTFTDVQAFEHYGVTNLVFTMDDDVQLDAGILAMWRLKTYDNYGGTWLSDYLQSKLDFHPQDDNVQELAVETIEKPKCPLIGTDGNVFNLIALASRTLKNSGMSDAAKEMSARVTSCGSYHEALGIIMEYVDPVDEQEMATDVDARFIMDEMEM